MFFILVARHFLTKAQRNQAERNPVFPCIYGADFANQSVR